MTFIYMSSAFAVKITFYANSDCTGSAVSFDVYDSCQDIAPTFYASAKTADADVTIYDIKGCTGNNIEVSSSCTILSFKPASAKRSPPGRS